MASELTRIQSQVEVSLFPNVIQLLFLPTTCTQNADIQLLLTDFGFPGILNATLFIQGNQLPSSMPKTSVAFILHIINFKPIKCVANILGRL